MDDTVPDIVFYEDGRCSLCKKYDEVSVNEVYYNSFGAQRLEKLVSKIKSGNSKNKYDCLIGVSGGVDSSYLAVLVKEQLGLNPLAVHMDNGWNSELAISNVENLLEKLDIDLVTNVLNWEEFRDLQKSFLLSSITNIEIPTDHAIWATLARTAAKHRIKYIFAGNNVVTEAVMPDSWLYGSKDLKLIQSIHRQYGKKSLNSYPRLSIFDYAYFFLFRGIKWIPVLNYIPFNKQEAKDILVDRFNWRDYGGKHYESIFTRFFHSYYLPQKFNIDLRKSYSSSLICSNQLSRAEALKDLDQPPAKAEILKEDYEYVKKKLGFSDDEFNTIMNSAPKLHLDYKNNEKIWKFFAGIVRFARNKITQV